MPRIQDLNVVGVSPAASQTGQACKNVVLKRGHGSFCSKEVMKIVEMSFFQVLQALSGNKEYVFNPTGWVLDEAGAEWNAIKIIFGEAAVSRVVSCEFHNKQSVKGASWTVPFWKPIRFQFLKK